MTLLVDGSNLLGVLRWDRESETSKRELVRLVAAYCRSARVRATVFFDGSRPASAFATSLGAVQVEFSGSTSADARIVARVEKANSPLRVVTSDRGIRERVRSRRVAVVSSEEMAHALRSLPEREPDQTPGESDWEAWFSDEKNRLDY